MTLHVETFLPIREKWLELPPIHFGMNPGSVANNLPDGSREIYLFGCISKDESVISKSKSGIDTELNLGLRFIASEGLEVLARLRDGEEFYLTVRPDNSPIDGKMRFTQRND